MTLVEIRCRVPRCGARLGAVEATPADWSGAVVVRQCREHPPAGSMPEGKERRCLLRPSDDDPAAAGAFYRLPYARLRPFIEKAWRTTRTQVYLV